MGCSVFCWLVFVGGFLNSCSSCCSGFCCWCVVYCFLCFIGC